MQNRQNKNNENVSEVSDFNVTMLTNAKNRRKQLHIPIILILRQNAFDIYHSLVSI